MPAIYGFSRVLALFGYWGRIEECLNNCRGTPLKTVDFMPQKGFLKMNDCGEAGFYTR